MNCPACKKILASTLSVCPSCGTMVYDTVREELSAKISTMEKTAKIENEKAEIISRAEKAKAETGLNMMQSYRRETSAKFEMPTKFESPAVPKPPTQAVSIPKPKSPKDETPKPAAQAIKQPLPQQPQQSVPMLSLATTKPHTSELIAKQTSPTLVEFQTKNAVLPEWRLQLQNSVRRRNGNMQSESADTISNQTVLATSGATALKAETFEQTAPAALKNPMLEKAMRRIEESRQKFSTEEKPQPSPFDAFQTQPRTFPYAVPNKPQNNFGNQSASAAVPCYTTKPKSSPILTEVKAEKFDTNKLPPLSAKVISSFEENSPQLVEGTNTFFEIKAAEEPDVVAYQEAAVEDLYAEEEADDRAPVSLRFNAGLFDLIIGSFISLILLAPFMLASGNLFTTQGLFAFLATTSIVMFIYLTTTIGTMGRTFGMRLFSLEIIDIEENAYPTFHQAAVSSSLYLVSLALGGVGFLTLFLNHEKRAAHDLISGTIVVREFE